MRTVAGWSLVSILGLALSGCATTSGMSVKSMAVAPPSLMVAKKVTRPLVLVLDPAKVPNEMHVLVDGNDRGGVLTDVSEFVSRDLKNTFSTYFNEVLVVAPGAPLPATPHVVADVKLDRVEVLITSRRESGIMNYTGGVAALTWAIALRPSEANEYLYSFAGETDGAPTEDPNMAFRSMFEGAITAFLKGYTDKHVHETLLSLPAPEQPNPAVNSL